MLGIDLAIWLAVIGPPVIVIVWELVRPTAQRVPSGIARIYRWNRKVVRNKVIDPLWLRRIRWKHGTRIEALVVDTYDDYQALSEEDKRLFNRLRFRDWFKLLGEHLDRVPAWELEAQGKADKAASTHAVFTQSKVQLECWNCAFFVGDLEKIRGEYRRNPYGGHCYRELPSQKTHPDGFCSHHSALQGYLRSQAGMYNIAPVK